MQPLATERATLGTEASAPCLARSLPTLYAAVVSRTPADLQVPGESELL